MRVQNIDIARVFAVISVVIFHAEKSWLPGGFLGVDLFYVISGFVVSKTLIENRTTYRMFLMRRFFRLAPVALLTIVGTVIVFGSFGYDVLSQEHYTSALLSMLFSSNVYYAFDIFYFDPVAQGNPFLHFWSLNVEEQFYFLWPLFCLSFFNLKPVYRIILAAFWLVVSFAIFKWSEDIAFYLMPYRISQFLSGALLYSVYVSSNTHVKTSNNFDRWSILVLLFGYISITVLMITLDTNSSWLIVFLLPTILFFVLVLGSIFVRRTIKNSNPNIALNSILFVGRASYSIYLVHWPITVFMHLKFGVDVTINLIIIIASILLGCLLYTSIEKNIIMEPDGTLRLFGTKAKGVTSFNRRNHKRIKNALISFILFPLSIIIATITYSKYTTKDDFYERLLEKKSAQLNRTLNDHLAPVSEGKSEIEQKSELGTVGNANVIASQNINDAVHLDNTHDAKTKHKNTQSIESYIRLRKGKKRRQEFKDKLSSCNTYEPGRREGNLKNKLLGDLDLDFCLSGHSLLLTDSTGPLAAQFIASVYVDIPELAILASAGCFYPKKIDKITFPNSDCQLMNKFRTELLTSSDKKYKNIFYAFNTLHSEIIDFLGTIDTNVVLFSHQPKFNSKVSELIKMNGEKVNLLTHLTKDRHQISQKMELKANEYSNIDFIHWSALDFEKKNISAYNIKNEKKYADAYHQTQAGIEETIRLYFLNNCKITNWPDVCSLELD